MKRAQSLDVVACPRIPDCPPKITNRVRELREAHGNVTQAEPGDAIGVTRQTIIAIEQDRYAPSLESAFRIDRHFKGFGWACLSWQPESHCEDHD